MDHDNEKKKSKNTDLQEAVDLEGKVLDQYIDALDRIAKGDPSVKVSVDTDNAELQKLGGKLNETAKGLQRIIDQTHEEAIDLTEYFDVLNKLNSGDYTARVEARTRSNELMDLMQERINKLAQVYEDSVRSSNELAISASVLMDITQQIGKGKFDIDVPVDSKIEVMNALAKSIGQMAKDLKSAYRLIQELSSPCIKVWENIVVMPLVGTLTSDRARKAMESILSETMNLGARVSIIDVTGIPLMDTATADYIIKTVKAIKILGAEPIITGISPEVAGTIVKMGVELGDVVTRSTLADGLKYALKKTGLEVRIQKDN
jgi:anti-anti-sigma regulatory factor/HAMP domain-containing protein